MGPMGSVALSSQPNFDTFSVSAAMTEIVEFLIIQRSYLFGDLKESSLAFWWNKVFSLLPSSSLFLTCLPTARRCSRHSCSDSQKRSEEKDNWKSHSRTTQE